MNDFEFFLRKTKEIGYVHSFFHSVAYVSGLPGLTIDEMIITETGKRGIVHSLKEDLAEILMIDVENLKIGEKVTRTGRIFEIEVGPGLLGRIVNPLSMPLDTLEEPIRGEKEFREIKKEAPSFKERAMVNKPLETGVAVVDFLVPIGYGQRELVIGDAKTGKTTFLLQAIVSQVKKETICVYTGIGKKDADIKLIEEYLKKQGVFEKTVIVHTAPDDSAVLNFLAPFSGMNIAEYFRDQGKNVLLILDDLTTHAKVYREISLLLKRPPGRECYPGEIFYLQASLLERAGNIKKDGKEISITVLPVAETLENDVSGFIQTNLIAMTDGHIFFDINEFRKGKRPAINAFLSVSRVGNQTKSIIEKELASLIRKKMIEYQRILELSQFGTELSKETQQLIEFGKKLELLFNQEPEKIIPRELQLILVGLLFSDFWTEKSLTKMKTEIDKIFENYMKKSWPRLEEKIEEIKDLSHLKFLIKEISLEIEKIL